MATRFDQDVWICDAQYGIVAKGGGSQGSSTNTTVNTPPPEVLAAYKDVLGKAQNVAATPLQQYGSPMVAGFTPDQASAFNTINNVQGIQQPYYNAATNLIGDSTQNLWNSTQQFSPQNVQQYQSPYTQDVINSSLATMNNQDAMQQEQLKGNAISKGAWGGDRAGVAQGILGGQQALARNQTIAGLNNQGYQQALGEFNQQQGTQLGANQATAQLGQQGAFGLAGIGSQAQQAALTGAQAQLQSGTLQQQLGQQVLNVPYQQFQQQQAYPFQTTQFLSNIATGIGGSSGGSSTATSNPASPDPWGQALGTGLGILGTAAMFAKDGGRVPFTHYAPGGAVNDFGIPEIGSSFIPLGQMGHGMSMPNAQAPEAPKDDTPDMLKTLSSMKSSKDDKDRGPSLFSRVGDWIQNHSADSGPSSFGGVTNKLAGSPLSWTGAAAAIPDASGAATMMSGINPASMMAGSGMASGASAAEALMPSMAATALPEAAAGAAGMGSMAELLPFLMLNRGGAVPHLANGGNASGLVRVTHPRTGQAAMVPPDVDKQLELYERAGNTAASDKLFAKYASSGLATGGMVPHMARGGIEPPPSLFDLPDVSQSPVPGMQVASADNPDAMTPDQALAAISPSQLVPQQQTMGAQAPPQPSTMPTAQAQAPAAQPAASGQSGFANALPPPSLVDIPEPQQKLDPWMALANAGFSMAAGTSPHAVTNIAQGALAGLKNYADQKKSVGEEAEKLTALKFHNLDAEVQGQKLAEEAKDKAIMLKRMEEDSQSLREYRQQELGLRKQEQDASRLKVIPDGMGGFLQYDTRKPGSFERIPAPNDTADKNLHGEDYLNTIDPADAAYVRNVSNGEAPMPSPGSRSPKAQQRLQQIYQAFPEASAQAFAGVADFNRKEPGKTSRSINNLVGHLQTLDDLAGQLDNGNVRIFNDAAQRLAAATGKEAPTNFEVAKQIVADEAIKSIVGAGAGALADRAGLQKEFDKANSPAQLQGAIHTVGKLMSRQVGSLEQQFKASTKLKDYRSRYLEPDVDSYLKQFSESGSPAPSVPVIESPGDAAFQSLPSGAQFKTKDGKIRVKH